MASDDDPKPMTRDEFEAWREGLFDRHPHLTRPNVQPVLNAVSNSYYNNLVAEKGGHAEAQSYMRAHRDRTYNEFEHQVMETGRTFARIEKAKNGSSLVEEIQRDQYKRGIISYRPDFITKAEGEEIERERKARSRLGIMRVAG